MGKGMELVGQVGFETLSRYLPELRSFDQDRLDLSRVERIDSAGAALLLELTRRAAARGKPLVLSGANAQVRGLLEFFGLAPMLCWKEGET